MAISNHSEFVVHVVICFIKVCFYEACVANGYPGKIKMFSCLKGQGKLLNSEIICLANGFPWSFKKTSVRF